MENDNKYKIAPEDKKQFKLTYRRNVQIPYRTDRRDSKKIRNALPPGLIHSQESRIMTTFLIKGSLIYQDMKELGYFYYNVQIYDCFGANYSFVELLRYHILDAYNHRYINPLFPNIEKAFKDIFINNPKGKNKILNEFIDNINRLFKNLTMSITGMVKLPILILLNFNKSKRLNRTKKI